MRKQRFAPRFATAIVCSAMVVGSAQKSYAEPISIILTILAASVAAGAATNAINEEKGVEPQQVPEPTAVFQGFQINDYIERTREELTIPENPNGKRVYTRAVETEIQIVNGTTKQIGGSAGLSIPLPTLPISVEVGLSGYVSSAFQQNIGTTIIETHIAELESDSPCDLYGIRVVDRIAVGDVSYVKGSTQFNETVALVIGSNLTFFDACSD